MTTVDVRAGERQAIRERLSSVNLGVHALLDELSDDDLRHPSRNPARTVRAVLSHFVWSLEFPLARWPAPV